MTSAFLQTESIIDRRLSLLKKMLDLIFDIGPAQKPANGLLLWYTVTKNFVSSWIWPVGGKRRAHLLRRSVSVDTKRSGTIDLHG
jgi:hypothetical protein